MKLKNFSPLLFLAPLGAGGIAVIPFVMMQYTLKHGEGLITHAQLWGNNFSGFLAGYYYFLEAVMIIFGLLHFVLTFWFLKKISEWIKTDSFREMIKDPLKNSAILAPFISILMTMNIFIGPIRYFFPVFSNNFQSLFLPAMIFWSLLFLVIMWLEIYLLEISFKKGFNINKITFGWLLHPFLLGMLTVVGTGIAAMSKNSDISNLAGFLSMISGSMGIFLLLVKIIMIFKSHFQAEGLPEKEFLPSFLIVIPNITLFAISAFRFGHFLEKQHSFHLGAYFYIVIGLSFAFEIWYLIFGTYLLFNYFKDNHFKEFYESQWGLICPFVAFAVLGSFVYSSVIASPIVYTLIILGLLVSIIFYLELLFKQFKNLEK